MLISTWRKDRFVAKTFLWPQVLKMKRFADYYWNRPWNGTINAAIPGDGRLIIFYCVICYNLHRWHNDHNLDKDGYEMALMKRWGDDLEVVRKTLSPADQVRAYHFALLERYFSAFGPRTIAPPGCPLPGKGYYDKEGDAHAHH